MIERNRQPKSGRCPLARSGGSLRADAIAGSLAPRTMGLARGCRKIARPDPKVGDEVSESGAYCRRRPNSEAKSDRFEVMVPTTWEFSDNLSTEHSCRPLVTRRCTAVTQPAEGGLQFGQADRRVERGDQPEWGPNRGRRSVHFGVDTMSAILGAPTPAASLGRGGPAHVIRRAVPMRLPAAGFDTASGWGSRSPLWRP